MPEYIYKIDADAEPVRHGKWIRDEFGIMCGSCGLYAYRDKFGQPWESPYCPICGARMDNREERRMRKSDFEKLKKAQKKAIRKKEAEYTRENYKAYTVKWSYSKDQDILEFLDNYESPKALFTALIRKEMKRLDRRRRHEDAAL